MNNNSDTEIFFEKAVPFCEIKDDGLIETEHFLEASKSIVQFVQLLGTAFKPVKNDIEGNIVKIGQILDSDREKYKYLNSIVEIETATISCLRLREGTDALLWLNRALVYNQIFLSLFIGDYEKAKENEQLPEDISCHFKTAYELTLKKHHGWLVQKIFYLCMMAVPSRKSMVDFLGYSKLNLEPDEMQKLMTTNIQDYLKLLKQNTEAVSILLLSHQYQP